MIEKEWAYVPFWFSSFGSFINPDHTKSINETLVEYTEWLNTYVGERNYLMYTDYGTFLHPQGVHIKEEQDLLAFKLKFQL